MTVLTRMYLNPQTRGGRKLLANRQALHAAVQAAFPPDAFTAQDHRILWRVDSDGPRHALYLLSAVPPDLTHVVEQGGWVGQGWDTTDYDRLLSGLQRGQRWGFRLTANPVHSVSRPGQRGKVLPHVTVRQQTRWLVERSCDFGFTVITTGETPDGVPDVVVTQRQDHRFTRTGESEPRARGRVTLRVAQFDGSLQVEDASRFRHALVAGMGRAKAYGCGLMTLRRLEPAWQG